MTPDLDAAFERAHAARDGPALVALYRLAAGRAREADAAAFFLTQAYVHALEAGDPASAELHARLRAMGREE